jgi:hypothetical protein
MAGDQQLTQLAAVDEFVVSSAAAFNGKPVEQIRQFGTIQA